MRSDAERAATAREKYRTDLEHRERHKAAVRAHRAAMTPAELEADRARMRVANTPPARVEERRARDRERSRRKRAAVKALA